MPASDDVNRRLRESIQGDALRRCEAYGCAEPVQAQRGPSPHCAVHSKVFYDFALWLDGRLGSPAGFDLLPAYLDFDAARADWSAGRSNLRSLP